MKHKTLYERYRQQALWAYHGHAAPAIDEIAYRAAVGKRFGRLTEEEYNDILHICMACTIPTIDYDEDRKVAVEYLKDGSTLEYRMDAL